MIGITKIGTKLDFNVMSNSFGIKKLTEKQAIKLIKENGFRFKRTKQYGKIVCVTPIGDTYDFIEGLRDNKIYIENNGIGIR
jgi:hypothetical protein